MRIHPDLPIYYLDKLRLPVLYTPGTLAVTNREDAELIREIWSGSAANRKDGSDVVLSQMTWLIDHARKVVASREHWLAEGFNPECLTVYLSNLCNLSCVYCFADRNGNRRLDSLSQHHPVIQEEAFQAAAKLVVRNCAEKNRPFQLVLHGGGEPSIHWDLLCRFVNFSQSAAKRAGVEWIGYIATNGVLPVERAKWLGAKFQRIGLSCDGPPDIQNRQRPLINGGVTADWIEQTAKAVHDGGAQLEVRTTITAETVRRQKEILLYLVQTLGPENIRFEPVYKIGNESSQRSILDGVDDFATGFMEARQAALNLGVELSFSGVRLNELHGPYCNTLRQVLHVTPDCAVTACFFCVDGQDTIFADRIVGKFDQVNGCFQLDLGKIAWLRDQSTKIEDTCGNCFACYHCAKACPEICSVGKKKLSGSALRNSFRCQLNRTIGQLLIEEAAEDLVRGSEPPPVSICSTTVPYHMNRVLEAAPAEIKDRVVSLWQAAKSKYNLNDRGMPLPIWMEKGFRYSAEQSWQQLKRIILQSPSEPISIYVHIPFCDVRCAFCDCYSLSTPRDHRLHAEYVQGMLKDIMLWGGLATLSRRPVTTVHFGGGTPNFLNPRHFSSIISALSERFLITDKTEWAVESTVTILEDSQLAQLSEWGVKRLHIGVQTLEEPLRMHIGRRSPAWMVLERICKCLDAGFITSVDLLYGLPGETAAGSFDMIKQLISLGVHGISFYRFNRSRRNHHFIQKYEVGVPNIEHDYAMFLVADQIMEGAGYEKNHFSHYATKEDRNLYYTHARRGEDLLGMGASADGVFKGFHYRYPTLSRCTVLTHSDTPQLQGGIMESPRDRQVAKAIAQLMTGSVSQEVVHDMALSTLLEHWEECQLIKSSANKADLYQLTGNGAWFIQSMIREVEKQATINSKSMLQHT